MKNDSSKHHRQSIRLKAWDYAAPGAYFVTLCTFRRQQLLGEVIDDALRLNAIGTVVAEEWQRSAAIRAELVLDEWVVMPNHLHGLVHIVETTVDAGGDNADTTVGAHGRAPASVTGHGNTPAATVGAHGRPQGPPQRKPRSLGSFIAGFKSAVTTRVNVLRATPRAPLWQRNYYEHIVRNPRELDAIRRYIRDNPLKWSLDRDNPENSQHSPALVTGAAYLADLREYFA